jgi:uncharacterized protein
MERNILWTPWDGPGFEHLHLAWYDDGILADSVVIGMQDGRPFRIRYMIRCDERWRVREVRVDLLDESNQRIELLADGEGHWSDVAGDGVASLDGCIDADITATPFTNTLAIRRLGLAPGQSATLPVAYIVIPEMRVRLDQQRYTCLAAEASGGRYRYEGLRDGFSAELPVDSEGLVLDYPELFKRVAPAGHQ